MQPNPALLFQAKANGYIGLLKTLLLPLERIEERLVVFRRIRDEIKRKIEELLKSEPSEIPDPIASFKF